MGWFRSKHTFEDARLGRFTRMHTWWMSDPIATTVGKLAVTIVGDKDAPSAGGIELARHLIENPAQYIADAIAAVRKDTEAAEFIRGSGEIVVDGFAVEASGRFAVQLSLTEWPDAMIGVDFEDGKPCGIELAD